MLYVCVCVYACCFVLCVCVCVLLLLGGGGGGLALSAHFGLETSKKEYLYYNVPSFSFLGLGWWWRQGVEVGGGGGGRINNSSPPQDQVGKKAIHTSPLTLMLKVTNKLSKSQVKF